MFNFLRKKKKITESDYKLLEAVVVKLPSNYAYLIAQISDEFILDISPNELGDKGTYVLTLNSKLESRHSNKKLPEFFIVKDIIIWDKKKKSFESFELHILEGMLAGFKSTSEISDLDIEQIDTSNVKEKNFRNMDADIVKDVLGKIGDDILVKLNIEGSFKMEVPEGVFYTLKGIGNGDYISIDGNGAVYIMKHDPYEIKMIYSDKNIFLDDLKTGKLDF